jgi:hypothetical protein
MYRCPEMLSMPPSVSRKVCLLCAHPPPYKWPDHGIQQTILAADRAGRCTTESAKQEKLERPPLLVAKVIKAALGI